MKLKSFVVLAALIFAVSSVSAQDGNEPDSLKLVPVTTLQNGLPTQTFELVCSTFVDSAALSTLQFGWDWITNSATLTMDSAFPSAAFDAMAIGPFFFLDNSLATTNSMQTALASGTSIGTNFPVSASWQYVCTYYMTVTNWIPSSSIRIDTVELPGYLSTDYIFIPVGGERYEPVWGGPLIITGTAVEEINTDNLPNSARLEQNYPNPFNPETRIEFSIPRRSFVTIEVFNILGTRVRLLVNEQLSAGHKVVTWDSKDENGANVSSGIYFYKLVADDFTDTKKMILLK